MDLFKTWLVENPIAHRGLHNEEMPENSISAFKEAIKNGYPIETDIHQIADGTLIVFHDASLQRMTGKDGYVKNLKKEDLKNYTLHSTTQTIPTLEEFLELVDGQVPVLFEIKNSGKVGSLESAFVAQMKKYKGEYAVQSFNPFVLEYFKKNAPSIIRGQLSGYFKNERLGFFKTFALKRMWFNKKVSEPNFISYEAKHLPNMIVRKYKQIPLLAWTVRSQEEYMKVIKYCDNVIFEKFEPKI